MQALQIRTEIIESVLNHLSGTKSGIVGVDQCYPYQEEKRQAMKRWGRHIKKLTASGHFGPQLGGKSWRKLPIMFDKI